MGSEAGCKTGKKETRGVFLPCGLSGSGIIGWVMSNRGVVDLKKTDDAAGGLTLSPPDTGAECHGGALGGEAATGSDCGFAVGLGRRLKFCLRKALCKRGWWAGRHAPDQYGDPDDTPL